MSRIPKILWQSYKSIDRLPAESLPGIDSWLRLNPGWVYHFCSDEDIEAFFRAFRGGEYLELFHAMPLAVMKADLWRYSALYQFGGVYADIDTTCLAPLEDWLDPEVGMHVACENDRSFFCQWTFAAAAGHPMLGRVLELIRERVERGGGVDETRPHYVHHYTGPAMWSDAIRDYLGLRGTPNELLENKASRREKDLILYPTGYFGGAKVSHANGSISWRDLPGYDSWQRQRKDAANRIV